MNLQQIRYKLENLKGQRQQLAADIEAGSKQCGVLKQNAVDADEARVIIQTVAQATQKQLEYHVSEIVSLALAAVFDNPYALRLEFVVRRNKTEADIFFERDGERYKPVDASGGGAVDVAAFALRVAMWSLRRPRSRNTLVLDEPCKFVSADLRPRVGLMMKEISQRLNLQIIMVSHSAELIEAADKYFEVSIQKGVSHVKENNGTDNRLLPEEGRAADIQNIGNTGTQQRELDGSTQARRAPRPTRSQSAAQADHGERSQGVSTHRAPSRRRT